MAKRPITGTTTNNDSEPNVVVKYFRETRAELRKVTWPTQEETKNLTGIIVAVTLAMAIFLGLLDYIFQLVAAGIIVGEPLRIGVAALLLIAGAAAFYYNSQQE
jgi:preprotein translocase subunit SecE